MSPRISIFALAVALSFAGTLFGQEARSGPAEPPIDRQPAVSAAQLSDAIDKLGAFDLHARVEASRTVRRAPAGLAVPALTRAAREHTDGYVRYRALVLLAGFGDSSAAQVMRDLMADPNDRLRTVAYAWFEHHIDPSVVPALVDALGREQSEFVRPALLRTVAAHTNDPRARAAVEPLIVRGQDDFRGALIDALGDYRAAFALPAIADVARLDGPLQDDAVTSVGEIGDPSAHALLTELQRSGPKVVQPSVAAAMTLLGFNAAANLDYLKKSLVFAVTSEGNQPLLRGTSHALAVLAVRGNAEALKALVEAGVPARDPARESIALALGLVALRNSPLLLEVFEVTTNPAGAIDLLQEAFDLLSSEDYELERFYVEVRHEYWSEPENSPRRRLAEELIKELEF
jgi:HEAT repeat protein